MAKKSPRLSYKDKMRKIRPIVKFNYDLRRNLTPSQKAMITRYYTRIEELTSGPYGATVYYPRSKKNAQLAAKQTGVDDLPQLKGFIITGQAKNIRRSGNKLVYRQGSVTKIEYYIDPLKFISNTRGEIGKAIKSLKKSGAESFKIKTGEYEMKEAHTIGKIDDLIKEADYLKTRYSDITKNNYAGNWMRGIIGFKYAEQKSFEEYVEHRAKMKSGKRAKKNAGNMGSGRGNRSF